VVSTAITIGIDSIVSSMDCLNNNTSQFFSYATKTINNWNDYIHSDSINRLYDLMNDFSTMIYSIEDITWAYLSLITVFLLKIILILPLGKYEPKKSRTLSYNRSKIIFTFLCNNFTKMFPFCYNNRYKIIYIIFSMCCLYIGYIESPFIDDIIHQITTKYTEINIDTTQIKESYVYDKLSLTDGYDHPSQKKRRELIKHIYDMRKELHDLESNIRPIDNTVTFISVSLAYQVAGMLMFWAVYHMMTTMQ
jgi:hypothetical protein